MNFTIQIFTECHLLPANFTLALFMGCLCIYIITVNVSEHVLVIPWYGYDVIVLHKSEAKLRTSVDKYDIIQVNML